MSLPITNWGHLEEITIDEFSLTPGTYDSSSDTYDPPIWKTLLADITAIGIATSPVSQLRTLRLDSLVSAGGSNLLASCSALTSVDFPSLASYTGNYLLAGCSALTTVDLSSLANYTGGGLLASCSALTSVDLSSLTSCTGNYLLVDCSALTSVDFPSLTSYTGNYLLAGCIKLTSVSLPLLVSTGDYLLQGCTSLTTADLSSLVSAGSCLLFGCTALISLTINNNIKAENVNSIGQLIIGDITDGITPSGFIGNPVSPDAYTAVPLGCIVHRSGMADTTMETLLAEMCKDVTNANGSITSLTGDNVGKWVKSYTDGAGSIISVDDSAFSYNPLLTEVNFPSATNIDAFAFSCCASLETAIFPSVTYISGWAFQYCTSLKTLVLGGESITLGTGPFNGVDTTIIALSLSATESATVDRTGALPKWKNLSWKSVYTDV